MKTALFFLAFIAVAAAQFWHPLAPCAGDHECPMMGYCCRYNNVIFQNLCELRPQQGWPCDVTGVTSCPCTDGLVCKLMAGSMTQATCQLEVEA
ncbi:dickkopf-related protein 3-like [Branchiostoma floridae]|uniref:Dickkopf-related protein 3-like n=1 Tax=Branchiostoma floridae TaxID=7739 RepID=A0A9J7MZI0_BRAFL|nr:dickkopf-related protein 3-like [Branchiostoma floridae]